MRLLIPHPKSRLSLCSWPVGYKSKVPTTPSSDSINLQKWLTELKKTVSLLFINFLWKDTIKDPDEHRDGRDTWAKCERGSEPPCLPLSATSTGSPAQKLSTSHTVGIFKEASSHRQWSIISSISSSFPLSGEQKMGLKIPTWSWPGLSGDQSLHQESPH